MYKLEQLFQLLREFDSKVEINVDEDKQICITSESLGYEHYFQTCTDEDLNELEQEIIIFLNKEKLRLAFKEIEPDVQVEWEADNDIEIKSVKWDKDIYLELDEEYRTIDDLLELVNKIKRLKYIKCELCYENDYIEYIVSYKEWKYDYLKYKLYGTEESNNNIIYEIGPISKEFLTLIRMNERYDEYSDEELITLKIKNINSVTEISIEDEKFLDESEQIAKSVMFDISRKYGIDIYLSYFVCYCEDTGEEFDELDDEMIEKRCVLMNCYDRDLIQYYYIANQMELSEFQYLAFYRVIECIFDEVYKYETVQDIKSIINSNSFSSYDDIDISNIIDVVERFHKSKNDREKIKLVFEKYLKTEVRDEALYIANKDLIKILKDDLKLIKGKEELKDSQKVGNIIYDFRCKCTHSNREFNGRGNFDGGLEELQKYIKLIKKICQKIIVNYNITKYKH